MRLKKFFNSRNAQSIFAGILGMLLLVIVMTMILLYLKPSIVEVKNGGSVETFIVNISGLLAGVFAALIFLFTVNSIRFERLKRSHSWLIDSTNFHIKRLEGKLGMSNLDEKQPESLQNPSSRWPWGSHHTETLGHLEAAARTFWTLYDSGDPSTAPTNKMVSDWLEERGLSKDKAKAIASILRADGLPTGPRK